MLLILSGLPGTGKTTIAHELACRLGAVHIRIDSIEQALRNSGLFDTSMDDAGYRVGYAVAEDNLGLGLTVIAEGVETQEQLELLAKEGCQLYQGFLCSEPVTAVALAALLTD